MTPEEQITALKADVERITACEARTARRLEDLDRRATNAITMRRATIGIPALCIGAVIGYALGGYPLWAFLAFMGTLLAALAATAVYGWAMPSRKA